MKQAIKIKAKQVQAYLLGGGSEMEQRLLREGKIKRREDGRYELFSLEAVNGEGQLASPGDYFKVTEQDGERYPYPNGRAWFEENHTHLQGDTYAQKNAPLQVWQYGDPVCEEIIWLLQTGRLTLNTKEDSRYFNAFLWGAPLSAPKNATVIFYSVDRGEKGEITDISFNFIAPEVFATDYKML